MDIEALLREAQEHKRCLCDNNKPSHCGECPGVQEGIRGGEVIYVPPWLPAGAQLLVVGQSPGPREAEEGKPFVGPAGQQLREWLTAVGLAPEEVAYTNVHPYFHADDPNYVPKVREAREGYERVCEEAAGNQCVLLLGASASHLVFKGRMGEMHGRQGRIADVPAFACYHPSYYLRARGFKKRAEIESEVLGVLQQVVAVLGGESAEVVLPVPEYASEVVIT